MRDRRHGLSLIELLVAMAIVAVLIGLLLAAVQSVRRAATLAQSTNNMRQMALGLHQVADQMNGFAGGLTNPKVANRDVFNNLLDRNPLQGTPHVVIIRMIDATPITGRKATEGLRPYLLSPGDPTDWQHYRKVSDSVTGVELYENGGPTSYAFNMVAFTGPARIPADLQDGLSNTTAFAERYFVTYKISALTPNMREDHLPASNLAYSCGGQAFDDFIPGVLNNLGDRRPSFADAGWGDVVPVTTGNPPVTRPSVPGVTFQVQPKLREADMRLPQTPFAAGLPVSLFDGSVRVLRPGIAPEVFWALVTPAGGETVGDF